MAYSDSAKDRDVLQGLVERCVCHAVRKASRAATKLYDNALSPSGIKATQFMILLVTEYLGKVSVSALAREMVMDSSTVARNLQPLEKNGFLTLETGVDRRQKLVSLTEEGRKLLYVCLPLWEETRTKMSALLNTKTQNSILSSMEELINASQIQLNSDKSDDKDVRHAAE